MSDAAPTAQAIARYAERCRHLDREMLIHRVPDQLRRLLVAVRLLSWDKLREAAPVADQLALAKATHMNPGDCSRAIAEAGKLKLLRVLRLGGRWWFELLPDSAVWIERSTTKVEGKRATAKKSKRAPAEEEVAAARAAWKVLEEDGDPAQAQLPIGETQSHSPLPDGGFGDAMAQTSRDQADAKLRAHAAASPTANWEIPNPSSTPPLGVPGKLGNSQYSGQNPNPQELGISQFTHAGGAPARHDHDHEKNDNDHDHDHDSVAAGKPEALRAARRRENLTQAGRDLFDEMREALEEVGQEMTMSYELLWAPRISLRPHDALAALQDALRMKKEGKIRKCFGGTLNRLYLDYSGEKPAPFRR